VSQADRSVAQRRLRRVAVAAPVPAAADDRWTGDGARVRAAGGDLARVLVASGDGARVPVASDDRGRVPVESGDRATIAAASDDSATGGLAAGGVGTGGAGAGGVGAGDLAGGGWVPRAVRSAADEYAWTHPAPDEDDEPAVGGVRRVAEQRPIRWAVPWRVAATAALAVAIVVGAAVLRSVALMPGAAVDLPDPAPLGAATTAPDSAAASGGDPTPAAATPGVVVVDVVGAVAAPGVQRLPAGARVVDAVAAAGGATADADLARVNLARVLVDGEQIVVPRPGDPTPAQASQPTAGSATVDLNTASLAELDTLPDVGPVLAQRIVDRRPYTSVDELDEVSGIGPTLLERLRPLVRV
jgi:competence protein ComEA